MKFIFFFLISSFMIASGCSETLKNNANKEHNSKEKSKEFYNLVHALNFAKVRKLPVLIHFSAYGCVNAIKMDQMIRENEKINSFIQENFVVATLYCDDRTPLPKNEIRFSEVCNGEIKTFGNKWSEMQIENYNSFQQPLYVVIDYKGNDLTETFGYSSDIQSFKLFLSKGISKFKK
ncbi:MAG: hypothetical protein ACKO7P_15405 [Bacteroidota bacterium]